jgi:ribosomal protein S18 acetylase RimI-like enzyme
LVAVGNAERFAYLRPAIDADESFLFEVFCSTWEEEVAAMPNPALTQHFLRIQYTAQNRRFATRFPGYERHVVLHDDKDAGRFYLHRTPTMLHAIDMTLLPEFRSLGIGTTMVREAFEEATEHGQTVSLRVARRNQRAAALYDSLGFRLVTMDDMDCYFEWTPGETPNPFAT